MKKILIVSDYVWNIGGIEVYMKNAGDLLINDGYNVWYFGLKATKFVKKYKAYLLPIVAANIWYTIRLWRKIRTYQPDIIRYHSVSRRLWWMPLWMASFYKSKKLMMYHDLGYFHPYPSKVTQEEQVLSFGRENFIKMSQQNNINTNIKNNSNIIHKMVVFLKYIHLKLLRNILKSSVDTHLVPSDFMKSILSKSRGIKSEKIETLPHFWWK